MCIKNANCYKIRCTAFLGRMQPNFLLRRLDFRCLQSVHLFLLFTGTSLHGQTEVTYFETDKIPLTVSSPRVISFAMQPSNNSQPNRRNRSHVGRCPLSDSSILHSDILLIGTPWFTPFRNKGASSTLKIEDTDFLTSLSEFSYYSIMIASGNQYNFTQNILFHLR